MVNQLLCCWRHNIDERSCSSFLDVTKWTLSFRPVRSIWLEKCIYWWWYVTAVISWWIDREIFSPNDECTNMAKLEILWTEHSSSQNEPERNSSYSGKQKGCPQQAAYWLWISCYHTTPHKAERQLNSLNLLQSILFGQIKLPKVFYCLFHYFVPALAHYAFMWCGTLQYSALELAIL